MGQRRQTKIVSELPQCVTDAKAALLEIPRDFQAAYIPKDNLTVNNFIRTKLPAGNLKDLEGTDDSCKLMQDSWVVQL